MERALIVLLVIILKMVTVSKIVMIIALNMDTLILLEDGLLFGPVDVEKFVNAVIQVIIWIIAISV